MPSTASTSQRLTFESVYTHFNVHPDCQKASQLVSTSADLAKKFAEMCGCLREALVAMDNGAHIQILGRFSQALFKNAFGSSPQLTTACTLLKKAFLEPPAIQQQGGKKQPSVIARVCHWYNQAVAAYVETVCANPEDNQAWRTKSAFVDVHGNPVQVTFNVEETLAQLNVYVGCLKPKQNTAVQNGVRDALKTGVLEKLVSSSPDNYPECYTQLCIRAVTEEEAKAFKQPAMAGQLGLFNGSQSVALQAPAVSTKPQLNKRKSVQRNTQLSSQASTSSGASGASIIRAGQVFAAYGGVVYKFHDLLVSGNHLVCFTSEDKRSSPNTPLFYVDGMLMPAGSANTIGEIKGKKFQEQVLETSSGNEVFNHLFNAIRVAIPAKLSFNGTDHAGEVCFLVAITDIAPGTQILCPYGWSEPKPVKPYFVHKDNPSSDACHIEETHGLSAGFAALKKSVSPEALEQAFALLASRQGDLFPPSNNRPQAPCASDGFLPSGVGGLLRELLSEPPPYEQ